MGWGAAEAARVVEKIVEVEKLVEVKVGASEEELREYREKEEKALREKEELRKQAAADMKQLLDQNTKTAQERQELEAKLVEEQAAREQASAKKKKMEDRIKAMEAKLIQGGKMMDKAALQEAELREAKIKMEQQKAEERRLAAEVQAKEEQALAIEEQFSTVQEEVEIKTKKLKKLWAKFQESESNLKRSVRPSSRRSPTCSTTSAPSTGSLSWRCWPTVPQDAAETIEGRAVWNEESENWDLPRLEIAGNSIRPKRPVSAGAEAPRDGLPRPKDLRLEQPLPSENILATGSTHRSYHRGSCYCWW